MSKIDDIKTPPSQEDLDNLVPVKPRLLPKKYTRTLNDRIFVNRSINLERIQWFGFDMDYTLAVYKSPEYEGLAYRLAVKKLLKKGYPKEIEKLNYDPSFPIRGLFLDKKLGNLLKIDNFGYILNCVKGRTVIKNVREIYQSRIIHPEEIGDRFFPIDTLFGLPEACLYADLVHMFEQLSKQGNSSSADSADGSSTKTTVSNEISYRNLFDDVRHAIHTSHIDDSMKIEVINNLEKYIEPNPKLAVLLDRMRKQGRKTFLLTNSEYFYTDKVMNYLLHGQNPEYKKWVDYFDIAITNAQKPTFFLNGSPLREIDMETGTLKFTPIQNNQFVKGQIYSGGSLALFKQFTNTSGSEVLYIGDNIYHDIIFSKKSRCLWRTLLVVRELNEELAQWQANKSDYYYLQNLEYLRAKTFQALDSSNQQAPNAAQLKAQIRSAIQKMDSKFNKWFGPVFRSGSNVTFFSYQVQRYSDLYASDYLHLLNYPFYYYFSALPILLPHENQVMQEEDDI